MFSLTRVVGDRLTCSCAFPQAFHPYDVVNNEFCQMVPQKSSSETTNYYDINCVSDLDEDGGPIDVCSRLIYMREYIMRLLFILEGLISIIFHCFLYF